jgi:hypothetical protein
MPEDLVREKRLLFLREHFLPADVRANWVRIRRRMIAKAIRRRWKREARGHRMGFVDAEKRKRPRL